MAIAVVACTSDAPTADVVRPDPPRGAPTMSAVAPPPLPTPPPLPPPAPPPRSTVEQVLAKADAKLVARANVIVDTTYDGYPGQCLNGAILQNYGFVVARSVRGPHAEGLPIDDHAALVPDVEEGRPYVLLLALSPARMTQLGDRTFGSMKPDELLAALPR